MKRSIFICCFSGWVGGEGNGERGRKRVPPYGRSPSSLNSKQKYKGRINSEHRRGTLHRGLQPTLARGWWRGLRQPSGPGRRWGGVSVSRTITAASLQEATGRDKFRNFKLPVLILSEASRQCPRILYPWSPCTISRAFWNTLWQPNLVFQWDAKSREYCLLFPLPTVALTPHTKPCVVC